MRFTYLAIALALAGCASHANYDDAALSEKARQHTGEAVQWAAQSDQAKAMTTLYDLMPEMSMQSLVELGLNQNPGVQQQLITLKAAQVQKRVTNAARVPQASASFSGNRQADSENSYSSSVTVSWELDLWMKLADNASAAQWDITTSRANLMAVENELAAEIMRGYLQVIANNALLDVEQARYTLLKNYETVILDRYRAGTGSLDDLDSARTDSASAKASVAEYTETVAESKRALALLLGQHSLDESLVERLQESSFPNVFTPLTQLPKQDLARRPDLVAAYSAIEANEYREKVAFKNLLPSIDLTAALTESGDTPAESLLKNPVWSLLGQITAPLFQGGQLQANLDAAELDTLNTWWAYQDTLLTAVKEVQDALGQEKSLSAQYDAIAEAIVNADRSATNYSDKYRQGLVDILDLLSVYQTRFDLKSQLIQTQFNQLSNRIDLGLALGLGVSHD